MLRTLSLFAAFLVASSSLFAQVNKIKDAGPDEKRINFVILGDGYTQPQLADFAADASSITTDFFNEPPFLQYTNFFNVHTLDVVSQESGADHPNIENSTSHPTLDVNTALDGTFDAFGIHRLLVVDNAKVRAQLAANYPVYDQAIIVVNSPFYGGSGGSTAVNSTHVSASDLAIHETGHSFMNLADEYDSGNNSERANVTSQANTGNVRWQDWIGMNGVGEFSRNGTTFKPVDGTCMMEFLNQGFCSVCSEQTIETIYNIISPLETTSPATTEVDFEGADLDFSITTIKPIPNTLTYEWELDGQAFANGTEDITLTAAELTDENHTLLVRVTDDTELSMKNANYVFTYEWTIMRSALPVEWISFTARAEDKLNRLDWEIAEPDGSSHFLVERSTAGGHWQELDRVNFTEASQYRYYDEFPLAGSNVYRIRAVDFDGTITDSPVREVRQVVRTFFKVWPTVTAGPVNYAVYADRQNETVTSVFSADGRVVLREVTESNEGWSQQQLDLGQLPAGSYTLRVMAGKEIHQQTVVVR